MGLLKTHKYQSSCFLGLLRRRRVEKYEVNAVFKEAVKAERDTRERCGEACQACGEKQGHE